MTEMDTNSRITTDLVLKLFDTLRESNRDVKITVDKQTEAIVHLSSLLKEGVTLEEIKKVIDDHNTHSGKHLDDIDTCTETISDNSSKILTLLSGMTKKVNTMILIVIIAFSLMTLSYLFVSNSVENIIEDKISSISLSSEMIYSNDYQLLKDEIDKLRDELKGYR